MRSLLLLFAALLLAGAAPPKPKLLTPTDIVNDAPKSAWKEVPADQLIVMDLQNGGRVIMQLAPQFAPVHVANIRALARGNYWDGATIYRVQDAYVVQWGQNDSEKGFPAGVIAKPPAEYTRPLKGLAIKPLGSPDPYAAGAGFVDGWPVAYSAKGNWANLAHCYGSVGVGRDLSPDTGTGGEHYAAVNPRRQRDPTIAGVGRIIDGMGNLSALPRGTEALGFYKDKSMYVPIASVRLASSIPERERPAYEYMDTQSASFAKYLKLRANRHDDFYIRPAGGVDLCNVNPPVRKKS